MRPVHYLMREPAAGLPLVALALNVLLAALLVIQTTRDRDRLRVSFAPAPAGSVATGEVAAARSAPKTGPLLAVQSLTAFSLDGEPLATIGDLEFRLAARAVPGAVLRLVPAPGLDAESLARVLRSCARAGFASVAIEPSRR